MNKVILFGHLGKEPQIKTFKEGRKVASFSLATNKRYKQGNEWKDRTYWHNCICWDSRAEYASKVLVKGSPVLIEGELTYRTYEDKNGVEKQVTEVQVLSFKPLAPKERKENPGLSHAPSFDGINTDFTGETKSIAQLSRERLEAQKKAVEIMEDDLPF